ncbi:SDR family oxidoreductase [Pseudohalioglobus lutimaris]|uniref:KR domain-containing protein n=1 Tax=Pseudohalioglobus lutimaris TaxID=1737061 RepID=A0A2N5X2S7_9GAMM|nr:SDR family oxidoreductase [Pseudohalioglobus lutimaris]PLW68760.1 KR domain-containing protein [Pseudohalioglobus lutimaris]
MSPRLDGKIALITGGGGGLGAATAHRFAEEGATVFVSDVDGDAARGVAASIVGLGGSAHARTQDVTDEKLWDSVVDGIVAECGGLHVLVNNAGVAITGNVEEASLADWRTTQAINGEGVFMGTRAAIRVMKNCGGSIINISSIEGIIGEANVPAYNYSKGGVRIFTKSAALHCAAEGYPIRVNSIHPGYISTAMVKDGIAAMAADVQAEIAERLQREIPLGSMGEPLDIANGCLFLASDESRYMTGAELVIDGGYTCH